MSYANLEQTLIRIKGATPDSPIAVFKTQVPGSLNAMFAATIKTQEMINENHPDLIGVFDGLMDIPAVKSLLASHVLPIPEAVAK